MFFCNHKFYTLSLLFLTTFPVVTNLCGMHTFDVGQEEELSELLFAKFGEWKTLRVYIGGMFHRASTKEVSIKYDKKPFYIKAWRDRLEIYKNNNGSGTPDLTINPNDVICTINNADDFYNSLKDRSFPELKPLPTPAEKATRMAEKQRLALEAEEKKKQKTIEKAAKEKNEAEERAVRAEKEKKAQYLSKFELCTIGTAWGGFAFTEISEYLKYKDEASKKAILAEIVANLLFISSLAVAEKYKYDEKKETYSDYAVGANIASRAVVVIALLKELFTPRSKVGASTKKTSSGKNTKAKNTKKFGHDTSATLNGIGKLATHVGAFLNVVNAHKLSSDSHVLMLLVQLAYALDVASKSKILSPGLRYLLTVVVGFSACAAEAADYILDDSTTEKTKTVNP